jgi:hypothetical protein
VAKQAFADLLDAPTVDKIKSADDYLSQIFNTIYKTATASVSAKPCTAPRKSVEDSSGQPVPH